jgi:hypothetical protein
MSYSSQQDEELRSRDGLFPMSSNPSARFAHAMLMARLHLKAQAAGVALFKMVVVENMKVNVIYTCYAL